MTVGLLALVVVVLGGVGYIYRRRGRRSIDLDALSASPYTDPPIRRTDQQSGMPQVLEGVPQPTRLSGAPMSTVDLGMSSGVDGSGPPPSYETPTYDWRVDQAQ